MHAGARPTLAQIAGEAKVSVSTVSKVLNDRPGIGADTRERVQALLREHRYEAPAARSVQSSKGTIGLVMDDLTSAYSLDIIRGVSDGGWDMGVDVVVGRSFAGRADDRSTKHGSWATRLERSGRRGVILVTTELADEHLADFERVGLPVVLIDPRNEVNLAVPSVGATNWTGGASATEHLIELGHTRIGFLGGPRLTACSQARLHGHQAALDRAGLPLPSDLVVHGTFHYREAHVLGRDLLDRQQRPTAIFAANDQSAIGVMQAAYELGLRIPDDLSIVGFDDTSIARWSTPPLTTVHAPLAQIGRVALRTLLQLVDGQSLDSQHVQLATELIVRESTGPPRAQT